MSKLVKSGIWYLAGLLLTGFPAVAQQPQKQKEVIIERIDIRGNRRMTEDNIRSYIQSRPGDVYDEERLQFDLRSIYKELKWFENIEVTSTDGDAGKIVTFLFKEKPLIREIKYVGNKSFTESNILDQFKERKVGIVQDSIYEPAKIRAAERALRDLLLQNGRPLGTVHSEIEQVPPSSVRLKFVIDEGPKVRIGDIRFVGAKVFSEEELKTALKLTKERGPTSIFKGTDKYFKDKLDYDLQTNLTAFYQERGYLQVQIGEPLTRIFEGPRGKIPMLRKTKEQFLVEIPIEAGDQYHLGDLKMNNCGIFKCDFLASLFQMKKGDVLNYKRVKTTIDNIKKLFGNYGFIDADLIPDQTPHPDTKSVDLTFNLEPGKQFTVHRIEFEGNTKTRDKVMRREFVIEEGKIFSSQLLETSVQRLNMLGYFEKIEDKDYNTVPDPKTAMVDVTVKVKEKSQQSIGLTGGVSGYSGSFIGMNYQTNNLMGRGESLEFSFTAGTRTTDFIVSFTEPYLMDTRWNMGISLFNSRNRFDTYSVFGYTNIVSGQPTQLFTQRTSGATLNLSRPLGRTWWRLGTSYTYQKIGVADIASGFEPFALGQFTGFAPGGDANAALKGIIRSEITPSLSYNSTNAFFNPTRGHSLTLSVGVAGSVLGGDFNLIRPSVEYRQFFPDKWISGRRNTFGFRFVGQYVKTFSNSTVPFFDRFFIGGETTIRGFDIRSVSPLVITSTRRLDPQGNPLIDLTTGLARIDRSINPIGGDAMGLFSGEYRVPIAGPLAMSLFYDMGLTTVTDRSVLGVFGATTSNALIASSNRVIRSSTGLEISFMLPMVNAPFRLIFAFNPQVYDNTVLIGTIPFSIKEPRHDIKFTIGRSF
ncbi:MAG: outer membrane protein assembly factor BamA [Acidobacteriia bacterium]|nr:outer membrane protein assembly factor BamA [Terriglobia bacterium]